LFKAQNKRAYEGRVLGGLGTAYGELGRWQEAINFHTSALYIAREVKDKEEEALQLSNLGYAAVQANQLGDAVTRYRQALHLAYATNNRDNIVSTIVDLARLLVRSARHLDIAELLVDDAQKHDGMNRDLTRLKDSIQQEKLKATANGVQQIAVTGTAQDYAANAYKLLEG
jgi:tetratricopeptide (TPR) repeat protein